MLHAVETFRVPCRHVHHADQESNSVWTKRHLTMNDSHTATLICGFCFVSEACCGKKHPNALWNGPERRTAASKSRPTATALKLSETALFVQWLRFMSEPGLAGPVIKNKNMFWTLHAWLVFCRFERLFKNCVNVLFAWMFTWMADDLMGAKAVTVDKLLAALSWVTRTHSEMFVWAQLRIFFMPSNSRPCIGSVWNTMCGDCMDIFVRKHSAEHETMENKWDYESHRGQICPVPTFMCEPGALAKQAWQSSTNSRHDLVEPKHLSKV